MALGGGDASYDVPVPVSLFAADGAGGSGVAATEWRLDGGAWHTGTSVLIPAPDRTRRTQVLEYRSVDRAGNVEAPRRLSVAVDTTRRAADADPPGVPLPPSPVTGGLDARRDRSDVYRLRLRRGESIRLSVGRSDGRRLLRGTGSRSRCEGPTSSASGSRPNSCR